MSLDRIIVIALAVAFFGCVILLAIKNQRDKNKNDQPPSSSAQSSDGIALPFEPREKERRKSKN
jgi:hypothetical protein